MNEITAVICETNPFHNGHAALFREARAIAGENGILIAIMSGNFVQRGLPAIWDKYRRAGILLDGGADAVVELPYPWSAAGGECFCCAAVSLACSLCASHLVFGSECGDIEQLQKTERVLFSPEMMKKREACILAHPEWGAGKLHACLTMEAGVNALSANDKLAVWYIHALRGNTCQPCAVPRLPHSDTVTGAECLRKWMYDGEKEKIQRYVPEYVYTETQNVPMTEYSRYYEYLYSYFRFFAPHTYESDRLRETSGGLYERLWKAAHDSTDGNSFLAAAACKKFTNARIRRSALFAASGVTDRLLAAKPLYSILLAANSRGCAWLNERRKNADFPLITKPTDQEKLTDVAKEQYAFLQYADSVYAWIMPESQNSGYFLRKRPVIKK